jgi:hypothetical protein
MKEDFENELRELSPFLADLKKQKKEDGFQTPKFYFETLADKVLEKAQPKTVIVPPQYSNTPSLFTRVQAWLGSALSLNKSIALASVLFLAIGGWYFFKSNQKQDMNACSELACVPKDEIKSYIQENINDFEEELLIKNISLVENNEEDFLKHLDENEVEQYLIEHLDERDLEN